MRETERLKREGIVDGRRRREDMGGEEREREKGENILGIRTTSFRRQYTPKFETMPETSMQDSSD